MTELIEIIFLVLITLTTFISWQGFRSEAYLERYAFIVDKMLIDREYYRLLTSGFLHVNCLHLIFNMASLYAFSVGVGHILGITNFISVYIGSLVIGNLLALYIHKEHGDYSAVGASGAVSGVIFSSIAIMPSAQIGFYFVSFSIPAWFFGIIYTLIAVYGIKRQADSIGHEAHLGGALGGIILTILIEPTILKMNYLPILAIALPAILFLILIAHRPEVLWIDGYWGKAKKRAEGIVDTSEYDDETLLNKLLEKVSEKGLQNLSKQEKQKLEELSKKIES